MNVIQNMHKSDMGYVHEAKVWIEHGFKKWEAEEGLLKFTSATWRDLTSLPRYIHTSTLHVRGPCRLLSRTRSGRSRSCHPVGCGKENDLEGKRYVCVPLRRFAVARADFVMLVERLSPLALDDQGDEAEFTGAI